MASRTKDNDFSEIRMTDDEREAHKRREEELLRKNLADKVERVKARIEREKLLPKKRKRKSKNGEIVETPMVDHDDLRNGHNESNNTKSIDNYQPEKEKVHKPKPPPPPVMSFSDLLKIAEKRQVEPVEIVIKKKEEEKLKLLQKSGLPKPSNSASFSTMNKNNVSKNGNPPQRLLELQRPPHGIKRYSSVLPPPTKKEKPGVKSENVKRFLEKQKAMEAAKATEREREKEKLLALRAQNSKNNKKAEIMASRTKDNDFSKMRMTDDKREAHKRREEELLRKNIADEVERMKACIEIKEREKLLPKKRKRKYNVLGKEENKQPVVIHVKSDKDPKFKIPKISVNTAPINFLSSKPKEINPAIIPKSGSNSNSLGKPFKSSSVNEHKKVNRPHNQKSSLKPKMPEKTFHKSPYLDPPRRLLEPQRPPHSSETQNFSRRNQYPYESYLNTSESITCSRKFTFAAPIQCWIIANKLQKSYAERIAERIKEIGISCNFLFNQAPLDSTISQMINEGILYVIIISPENEIRNSVTVCILQGTPQEHRNMILEDGLNLLDCNFHHYLLSEREYMERERTERGQYIGVSANQDVQFLLRMLADGCCLSLSEINILINYLCERRDNMQMSYDVSFGKDRAALRIDPALIRH